MPSESRPSPRPSQPRPSQQSTDLFIALGAVVKRIKHRPLPDNPLLHGLPFAPRHVSTMLQISQDAPIGMSELAERMTVSLATVSQVVTDLEEWGVVTRASDPADRRRTLVSIAPEHRDNIRAVFESRLRPLDRALRRLEPDERAGLVRGLLVLAEELDRTAADAGSRENAR